MEPMGAPPGFGVRGLEEHDASHLETRPLGLSGKLFLVISPFVVILSLLLVEWCVRGRS
jgi:hypothetical protein